jgi:uncharacterized membrane protein
MNWVHDSAAVSAAFMGSLVEFIEALTIVLAVGTTRGWRPALLGATAGIVALVIIVAALGPALLAIPIHALQLLVGILLLLFGMRWLRKAILRAGGVLALHDEDAAFEGERRVLSSARVAHRARVDPLGFLTAFKAVLLEGIEVVFIVVAVGAAGGLLLPASLGALVALALALLAGVFIRRPLARAPENSLKFAVGVLIAGFGIFWLGEGMGVAWPGEDWAIIGIVTVLLVTALGLVRAVRVLATRSMQPSQGIAP